VVYRDFAHAPSKVKATVSAVKAQHPQLEFTACVELHTFSSLTKDFLPQYKGSLNDADKAIVYYSPEVIASKKLEPIQAADVVSAFDAPELEVINQAAELHATLANLPKKGVVLLMSSGTFDGLDLGVFNN